MGMNGIIFEYMNEYGCHADLIYKWLFCQAPSTPPYPMWGQVIIPTAHFSDGPLFRQPIAPTAHFSDNPLFRQKWSKVV